ncbi:YwmB family TATA-box binding protein [Paenibacillus sp. TSA_86.1]|uniref:YwmB family TATA-box binding protein n=1 Tax=Paenibacillus sp. TSA_86.1 TaxID=3415649 RepID=UPI004045D204
MLKRWMNTGVIAIAIILLIGVTQVYAENVVADKHGSEVAGLEQLLHTADVVINDADQWVIKWQAGGKGDARAQAAKLAVVLELAAPVKVRQTGHDVYRSEGTVSSAKTGIEVLLNVAETDHDGYYIIVQLSGRADLDRQSLLALHEHVDKTMTGLGLKASWNMSVQGKLSGGNDRAITVDSSNAAQAGVEIKAGEPLAAMEAKLSRELHIIEVERYEDTATTSISYEATDLPLQIQSGSHLLNMQLAVHQVSGQGDARITVGFPIITIEY